MGNGAPHYYYNKPVCASSSSMGIEPIVVKTELATPQDFHVARDGS